MGRAVTVFLLLVCGVSALVTLGVAWLSDTWEREPLHLVENVLLLGVTVQLIIVIAGVSLFGFEDWSGAGTLSVVLPACALLPLATASLKELDEPFDGIVYAVAFACGGSLVQLMWDVPQLARQAGAGLLHPATFPGTRDLILLFAAPPVAARLGDHVTAMAVAVMAGAAFGWLAVRRRQRGLVKLAAVAGAVATALALTDAWLGGAGWLRLTLLLAALAVGITVKRASPFRERPEAAHPDLALDGLKATLLVIGACLPARVPAAHRTGWSVPPIRRHR